MVYNIENMKNNLYVLTASNPQAYQHYIDTIEEGFLLEDIREFLTDTEYEKLKVIYSDRKVRAWGATPGPQNIRNWEKLKEDDRVLIYRIKNFEYFSTVTYKLNNKKLAEKLWKINNEGQTWEYVYFLDNLTEISVPINIFNDILEYQSSFTPYGFYPISEDKVDYLINKFISIDGFLKYLEEGRWLEKSSEYSPTVKEEIIQEKITHSIEKTDMLEANLENFIADRTSDIEEGLHLIARQVDTGEVGRMDLLCEDKNKDLVVLELKRMKAGSSIIDQIQRYMGWVMTKKANEGQKVRGIIVVGKKDTALEYAVKANPNIAVKVFNISFQ